MGVNGKTFQELVDGNDGLDTMMKYPRGPLHFVVDYLKTVQRPMSVMFEQGDGATAVIAATTTTTAEKNNDNKDDTDSDDDDNDKEADIDWYDAKVLSFHAQTRIFTVQFLGDDKDVTYEMNLIPKLVRPSVRVWTRRALSLINLDEKLVSVGGYAEDEEEDGGDCGGTKEGGIDCGLPPSTDLPEDSKQLEIFSQIGNEEGGVILRSGRRRYRKLMEYSQLLEKQLYLASRLSPLIHEDDEDDDDDSNDVVGQEDHPGPLADSNYVEHLSNCMKEIKASCDWMICESAVLDILRTISNDDSSTVPSTDIKGESVSSTEFTTTKVSREVILQFLVNGSRFLNRLLSLDPDSKVCSSSQSNRKGGSHRGRKKRRIGETAIRTNHYATRSRGNFDSIFDNMLTRALLSNESLYSLVNQLLNNASLTNKFHRVWIIRTLTHGLSTLLMKLWTPVTNWISKSEDMISGASGQFYTIEDIERHAQYAEAKGTSLVLINVADWTTKLAVKINCARHFEVEVTNVLGACTQPVVAADKNIIGGLTENDDCILTLQRLQNEALCTTSPSMQADRPMQNINPLGRSLVNYNSGMILPSPLTRGVLNDAITVRRWVLDLSHANSIRERASFVQVTLHFLAICTLSAVYDCSHLSSPLLVKNVITRYVALPQLPSLPVIGADGAFANPSAMLENNTRDIMNILSSNCYSYNHIIMNISTRLQGSMNGDSDVLLRHKEEVLNSLAALQRLPILSIVEEELYVRDELIDWNEDAKRVMAMSAQVKLPFNQIESLDRKLTDILSLRSDRRAKVCHRLREDRLVDGQIQAFAGADLSIVCPTTGSWVRDEYRKGRDWMMSYRSIIAALVDAATNTTCNKESVEVTRITALLEEHDLQLAVKFPEEYGQLYAVKQNVDQWTHSIRQIVLSDSITLDERCQRLSDSARLRPKGVLVDPAGDVVDLWVRVFSWTQSMKLGVEKIMSDIGTQLPSQDDQEMTKLMLSVFAPLIIEGQDILLSDEDIARPYLKCLRAEAINALQTVSQPVLSKKTILESSAFGKSVLDRVLESKSDPSQDSCLLFGRQVFWMFMLKAFFSGLESDTAFPGDVLDAKALMLLRTENLPRGTPLDTRADETNLQTLIGIAEHLNSKAFAILDKCTVLLQANCDARSEELRDALLVLCDIQSDFNTSNPLAVKLLPDKSLSKRLHSRISWLTWLLNAFTYDIFNDRTPAQVTGSNRIHANNLRDLYDKIPNFNNRSMEGVGDSSDREIVRVSELVNNLWGHASQWRTNVAQLFPTFFGSDFDHSRIDDVVTLVDLTALTESPVLSKVS